MRKWLKRCLIALLIAIGGGVAYFAYIVARAHPTTDIVFFGGRLSAEAHLSSGAVVRIQMSPVFLTHLAEFERRLTVCAAPSGPCDRMWLMTDIGGARQVNLYRRRDGALVVMDWISLMEIDETEPVIRIYDREDEIASHLRTSNWNCRSEAPGNRAAKGEAIASTYFKEMDYLGMFGFFTDKDQLVGTVRFGEFRFVSSEAHGEWLCGYPRRG